MTAENITYINPDDLPSSFRMPEKTEGMSEAFHGVLVDRAIRKALKKTEFGGNYDGEDFDADYGKWGFDRWNR